MDTRTIETIGVIQNNIREYAEYYTLCVSILLFYYTPYLFFSVLFVFSLYGLYLNVLADFQFEIKYNYKKNKQKSKFSFDKLPDFDKPITDINSESGYNDNKTKTE